MRVSEKVTIHEINKWKSGDIITIKAGTGAGKSFFIKNNLYAIAKRDNKKILMLLHRRNCKDQFQDEIEKDKKTDIITLQTYQHIESLIRDNKTFNFDEYKYIICDEFHYFMSDAAFNKSTDMSLNAILNQNNKVRIFMSATGDHMAKYIRDYKKLETINYELPINFRFIKKLTFFNKDSTLEKFIGYAIEMNEKAIFFIQSATQAYNLYKKFKDVSVFNCGKSDKHYKHVDQEKIQSILKNEKFEELILITTTCMDAGVNIKDKNLKHIVCAVKDIGVLIQCMGRKRLEDKNDYFYLYIKTINNQQLGGMETQLNKKREMAEFLKDHTVKEFIEKYPRQSDDNQIVYDDIVEDQDKGTKKINWLMYFKCQTDLNEIEIMKKYDDFGYCKTLARMFGFYNEDDGYDYRLIEEDDKKDNLEEYLYSIAGKKLMKNEQTELINKIDLRVNRKQQKSYKKLNDGLKMINLPFIIVKNIDKRRTLEDGSFNPERDKTYWMIIKSLG
jgi:hypothetical protein